jgi:hypothetical protein
MFSTTAVLNACQARNDSGSLSSSFTGLVTQTRRQADLYVAGLLAKASEQPETTPHVDKVIAEAEVPLRPVEKKDAPW